MRKKARCPPFFHAAIVGNLAGVPFDFAHLGRLRTRFPVSKWAHGALVGGCSELSLIYFPLIAQRGHSVTTELLFQHFYSENLALLLVAVFLGKLLRCPGKGP